MKTLEKIWNWLDGKKTTIGAIAMIISQTPYLGDFIGTEAVEIIQYFGTAIGFGGVVHKVAKGKKEQK
jgi:hypothetical protein